MNYIAIDNNPNVSRSRLPSFSPSMQVDNEGRPHLAWINEVSSGNELNHLYFDGSEWLTKSDSSIVSLIDNDIAASSNLLTLDGSGNDYLALARTDNGQSGLSITSYDSKWSFSNLEVDYNSDWVGLVNQVSPSPFLSSSSSSSSHSLSSSSSSGTQFDENLYFVSHSKDDGKFRLYLVNGSTWTPLSTTSAFSDISDIKINVGGGRLSVTFLQDEQINYNFFDLNLFTWEFASFQTVSSAASVMSLGSTGTSDGVDLAWVSKDEMDVLVCESKILFDGSEVPSGSSKIVYQNDSVVVFSLSDDYMLDGYRNISISLDKDGNPKIFAAGARNTLFSFNGSNWADIDIDINAVESHIVPSCLESVCVDDRVNVVIGNGDIYYLVPSDNSSDHGSDLSILTNNYSYNFVSESNVSSSTTIDGIFNNKNGDILRDAVDENMVVFGEQTGYVDIVDINESEFIASRQVQFDEHVSSLSFDQVDGKYLSSIPYDADLSMDGEVVVSSKTSQFDTPVIIKDLNDDGVVFSPRDAVFDYVRRKIWIADTGN